MRRRGVGLLLVLAGLGVACAAPGEDEAGTGESAHTARDYVVDNSPYAWASEPYEAFRAAQSQWGGESEGSPIADDEALTQRVQTWLDRIDRVVRDEVARKTGTPLIAPRPIAKVLASKTKWNAWVSGSFACLGAPLGGGAPGVKSLVLADGVWKLPSGTCARVPGWSSDGYLRYVASAPRPSCALTSREGARLQLTPSAACQVEPGADSAEEAVVTATSPYIQFSSDILADFDEPTLAAVAAHEAGHYYLAHGSTRSRTEYGFWYVVDERSTRKPTRAAGSADLEAAYREVESGQPNQPAFSAVYSPRLVPLLVRSLAPLLLENAAPGCADASGVLQRQPAIWRATESAPSPEARAAFQAFERALAQCAPRVLLRDGAEGTLSAGKLLLAAGRERPGPRVKLSLRPGDTLADFLGRLDASARELDVKAARLVTRARTNGLGLYTHEQAADDFMLELSTRLGFTSEEVQEAWLHFMRASDARLDAQYGAASMRQWRAQTREVSASDCEAMLRAGFAQGTDGRPSPMFVSLGDLTSAHHASCYRLFNLRREANAHRYLPGPRSELLAPEAWEALRLRARELSNAAP
jgi:hypothetical protein